MGSQYLAPGCYGKLRFEREYLDHNVSYPSSRAFKDWMHDGRMGAGESIRETRSLRFVFGTPGSVDVLVGVVRPSADLGGLREFPFAVFAHVPRKTCGRRFELVPLAVAPVWDALDDLWDSLSAVATPSAFAGLLAGARVPGPRDPAEVEAEYQVAQRDSAARLFAGGDGASLAALRRNLPEVLKHLKRNAETVRLELPVGTGLDEAAFDASFWVSLLNRGFLWKRLEPQIFLDAGRPGGTRRLLLSFGAMAPGDYGWVMGSGPAASVVQRPAHADRAGADPEGGGEPPTFADLAGARFS